MVLLGDGKFQCIFLPFVYFSYNNEFGLLLRR